MLFLANYIIAIRNEILEPNLSKTLKEIEVIENLPKNEDETVNKELKRLTEQKNNFQSIYSQFKVEIYYSIDENVFCLQIENNEIEQKLIKGDEETERDYTIKKILQDETFDFKEFFYSIAINYLEVAPFQSYELEKVELPDKTIDAYRISISDLSIAIMPIAITQQNIIRFIPPSLFDIELELNSIKEDESSTYYSMLSSGEQQLVQSVESILYHINNLESVHTDKSNTIVSKKVYKIVNIVLDEIELYFHPEYQRKFISHLIKRLSELGTDKIKVFNILFATHSPFILSDIPSSNILRLKDGDPESDLNQTFGANIHDLLANDFFLEKGFMGEFAKEKIKSVINFLNYHINKNEIQRLENVVESRRKDYEKLKITALDAENKYLENESELELDEKYKDDYKTIIEIVGESLIQDKLNDMFNQAFKKNIHA